MELTTILRRMSGEEIMSVLSLSNRPTKVRITFPDPTQWSYSTLIADGATVESDGSAPMLNLEGFGYLIAKRK